jgi:signal transduction histidine kinase
MTAAQLTASALAIGCLLYSLLVLAALRRGSLREGSTRALVLYAAVSGLWVVEQVAARLGWLDLLGLNPYILVRLPLYGLLLLALLFFYLARAFLRRPGTAWGCAVLGILWIAALVLLDSETLTVPAWLWLAGGWGPSRLGWTFGLAVGGWGLWMGASLLLTLRAYRRSQLPLHRNRLLYWLPVWTITVAGDLLFVTGHEVLGGDVRLLGTLVAAYVVLTHRLPDVRQALRRTASYLLITVLTVATYTVGFTAVHYFFRDLPGYSPLWAGAAVALILAVLFDPLLSLVERLLNRLFAGVRYDAARMVREYSLRISNIVSLERLATVVVELIGKALGSRSGVLFVVNYEKDEFRRETYELRGIRGLEEGEPPTGTLSARSPLTHHFREERRPLTQYDVDLLPAFQRLDAAEHAWLSSLNADVYVPIHAQGSWIGLLALGSLADQTAIALENARLVDDLVQINADLTEAYEALATANRQLQEMDRLKSAFIGVITHELRSPFANIAFSLELFQRYGLDNLTPEQRGQLEQLLHSLKQARQMIDNLVTFATFLSKQGELRLVELDFRQVIDETLPTLRTLAEAKKLGFRVRVPERLPAVRCDRERLSDAVYHLVHNAIKFNKPGGEVWIHCETTADLLRFQVKDTGVGVPPDKLPGLWEGFAQMADPLRRGVEGLGLGLALVKYIVTAHRGRVWAESREGAGSTFGFEIPLSGPK